MLLGKLLIACRKLFPVIAAIGLLATIQARAQVLDQEWLYLHAGYNLSHPPKIIKLRQVYQYKSDIYVVVSYRNAGGVDALGRWQWGSSNSVDIWIDAPLIAFSGRYNAIYHKADEDEFIPLHPELGRLLWHEGTIVNGYDYQAWPGWILPWLEYGFGWTNIRQYPWIWIQHYGWFYCFRLVDSMYFLYSPRSGWCYTQMMYTNRFPKVYLVELGLWTELLPID